MSLLPKRGKCFHCGHDHGEGYGSPRELELILRIADLERQNAELVRQLAAQSEDVARYQWTRNEGCNFVWVEIGAGNCLAGLDAAIDQAMQAGKEPT